jgi:methyl-accepting chemotaxis protein
MIKKFFNYMLAGYEASSIEIKKKAKLLLACVVIFFITDIPTLPLLLFGKINFPSYVIYTIITVLVLSMIFYVFIISLIKRTKYNIAVIVMLCNIAAVMTVSFLLMKAASLYQLTYYIFIFIVLLLASFLFSYRLHQVIFVSGYILAVYILLLAKDIGFDEIFKDPANMVIVLVTILFFAVIDVLVVINYGNVKAILNIAMKEAEDNGKTAAENKRIAELVKNTNSALTGVIAKANEIIVNLNSLTKEIEAAAQEQTTASNEHASGITEVSATLKELTITAKQITNNVGELVLSSEEAMKLLKESEKQLLATVSQLEDVGVMSRNNTTQINELGKRSVLINEMVELIKEIANKTNILSINASIEASRSGETGAGFSVVAAEIRELSKETIESAKKAEVAAREIKNFLDLIIISSENESSKVLGSGNTVKSVSENVRSVVSKINNNYSFTQKIDVSIKQQEIGSVQASETMMQMAEIARQTAETARQTLTAVKDIISVSRELEKVVSNANKISTFAT